MDAAQEFAKDCVFNDILTCPKCKWDVGIDNVIE